MIEHLRISRGAGMDDESTVTEVEESMGKLGDGELVASPVCVG